jgi:hypothetical protein
MAFVDFAVEWANKSDSYRRKSGFNRFEASVNGCMDMLRVNLSTAS